MSIHANAFADIACNFNIQMRYHQLDLLRQFGVAPPWVLWAVLGTSVQGGHQTSAVSPEAGDQDGERSQGQDLQGVAEVAWFVQLGEEKAEGAHMQSTTSAEGKVLPSSVWWPVTGHREVEWSCIRGTPDWTLGKSSWLREWSVTGTAFPGKWPQHQVSEFQKHQVNTSSHTI